MKKSTSSPSYVDPSSLSLPSPASDASSPIHVASTSSTDTPASTAPSASTSQPPRKRQRTDTSPEEKREARAHRNRIAAQNSRDRRKLQFSHLEESVRLLKEENEQLRAELQRERERRDNAEKDKENAELKERVKSLEQGWEAVVKALQSQGLPSSFFTSQSPSHSSPEPKPDPPATTFPVFINTPVAFPPTPLSIASSPPTVANQPDSNDGSIRHLARVASVAASPAASLQRMDPSILRRCPPSISMRRLSYSKRPLAITTRRLRTGSNIGSLKCCQPTTLAHQTTPSQRRRLVAYLLLAMTKAHYNMGRRPPRPPPRV